MPRPTWPEYFMSLAHAVSARGTCDRKKVGCVLVLEKRIVSTGYNGSAPGLPHCDDAGHDMEDGHCVRTNHAEQNAILQAARYGIPLAGAEAYSNTFPCWPCFRALATVGVRAIYFDDDYRNDDRVLDAAVSLKIDLVPPSQWKPADPDALPVF